MDWNDKEARREYDRKYYQKRRQAIFDYLGNKCVICGSQENLEIDHINRSKKSFHISKRLSVKNNKDELDKCQLLCESHHQEKTSREQTGFTHGSFYGWMKVKCTCDLCIKAKWAFHDKRNAKRRKGNGYKTNRGQ